MDWLVKPYRHKTTRVQRWPVLVFCALLVVPIFGWPQRGVPTTEASVTTQDYHMSDPDELEFTTEEETNVTDGSLLGSRCDKTCDTKLSNVYCDPVTQRCECDKGFPVKLGPTRGCSKPARLGEQCFYSETCMFTDPNAACIQIEHNAICNCKPGYHSVSVQRPTKRTFCSEDMVLLTTDIPTLFGVASGLAIFTGLLCFVLKLFSSARYTRPRHYANANLAPPILFSSDTGIPLAVGGGRPSSRTSQRSYASGYSRRPSSGGSRGVLVAASRAGSRRPSLASLHSNASSTRSYSMRRFERENQQRELRKQQLQENLHLSSQSDSGAPIPSPKTPQSTDELLPSVCEQGELFITLQEGYSMAISRPSNSGGNHLIITGYQGEIGPCTSSDHH